MIVAANQTENIDEYNCKEDEVKLNSAAKDRIRNAVISTSFKKHYHEIMSEGRPTKSHLVSYFICFQ